VWNLSAKGGQIMRAAACKILVKTPTGFFAKLSRPKGRLYFLKRETN